MKDVQEKETKETSMTDELRKMYQDVIENWGITSFDDFQDIDRSDDVIQDLITLHSISSMMLYNIMDYSPEKISSAKKLLSDYYSMGITLLSEYDTTTKEVDDEATSEKNKTIIDKVKNIINSFNEKIKSKKNFNSGGNNEIVSGKTDGSLFVFKDKNGSLRWFARFSNNYRDDDNPSEIISKESHLRFVDMVDSGKVPAPELWHWHVPGTKWGVADWVAFDEDNGIAMASGTVLPGHEKEAENLSNMEIPIGVSHGMPEDSVVRDESDSTIIVGHITREISDLPLSAAANKLTDFSILKEKDDMKIPDRKKEYLREVGFSDELIKEIESGNSKISKEAHDANLESKEVDGVDENVANESEAPVSENNEKENDTTSGEEVHTEDAVVENDNTTEAETDNKESVEETVPLTAKEVADAIAQVVEILSDKIKSLSDKIESLETEREESKKKESDNHEVPTASLAAMIATQMRAIGNENNSVRKNSSLLKDAPSETPAEDAENNLVSTGNPVIDSVISGVIGRK